MVTSGGMTKRLGALESRGLITRVEDHDDRRSRKVALTERGRRLAEKVVEAHTQNERRLLAALPRKRFRELAALLEELAVSLGDEEALPLPSARSMPRRARR